MSETEFQKGVTFAFYVMLLESVSPEKGVKVMKMLLEKKKKNPEHAEVIDAILKTHIRKIVSLGAFEKG